MVESTGGDLQDAEALASVWGVRSLRSTSRLFDKISGLLTAEEKPLLEGNCIGTILPNENDLFPDIDVMAGF